MFSLRVQNLDNNALSASICSCEKKFLSTWSMFWWTKVHLLIGSTVSRDQFALSLNLGIWIVFTVTQQKKNWKPSSHGPVEEAKEMKFYKRQICKQFVQV